MKNIVARYIQAFLYQLLGVNYIKKSQNKRLKELVEYAKKNSPAYKELYKNVEQNFDITDLPVITKEMIMNNYNQWVTDSGISIEELNKFTNDIDNVGIKYKGKYIVCKTSGTTGHPFTMIHDVYFQRDTSAASIFLKDMLSHTPVVTICPAKQHILTTTTLLDNIKKYPFIKKKYILLDAMLPTETIVEELNRIQPAQIIVYPSFLDVLIDYKENGKLKIAPTVIVTESEVLSEQLRKRAEEEFCCIVKSIYGCTEMGNIAYECDNRVHHISNNNVIMEPVDDNYAPVGLGEVSKYVLYTNLSDHALPLIRYVVKDSVTIVENCDCGTEKQGFVIKGRESSKPILLRKDRTIEKIAPINLYILIETWESIRTFQFIAHGYDEIELRIVQMPGYEWSEVSKKALLTIQEYLKANGFNFIKTYATNEKPIVDSKSLKYRYCYQLGIE